MNSRKQMLTAIALLSIFAIVAGMVVLPASAHDPAWTIPTNAYCTVTPNPVQVGTTATFVMWVDQNPPTAAGTSGPRWENYKLDITKPDGSKQVIDGITATSATASQWYNYVPDQVGTYTVVFSWPGQTLANITGEGIRTGGLPYVGDFFAGSTAAPITLTVQQEPIDQWQSSPLPTEYWQRPIHGANREWSILASNWLKGSWLVENFQRWGTAPNSPHIMWTQPITPGLPGGINDAAWPGIPSNKRDYESPWSSAIIMNGKIYYNAPSVADVATYGYYCRDLYTGELLWYKNGTDNGLTIPPDNVIYSGIGGAGVYSGQRYVGLSQGWLYHYSSVNGQGIVAYLIMTSGSTWYFLDANNGNWMFTLKNVPSGTTITDQDGSILRYSYNRNTGNLLCWNLTQAIFPASPAGTGQQQWKPMLGGTYDAVNDTTWYDWGLAPGRGFFEAEDILPRSGYTMNVTIESGLPGSISVLQDDNRVPKYIVGIASPASLTPGLGAGLSGNTFSAWVARIDEHVAPYSPWPKKTNTQNTNLGFGVTLLWKKDYTVPLTGNYTWSVGEPNYNTMLFILSNKQTIQRWGYSLETGNLVWGPTTPEGEMNYYGMSTDRAYLNLYGTGYAGTLYCYDATTGALKWTYNCTSIGSESPYGTNYPVSLSGICDGKIFLHSTEHSPTKPYWRGSYLRCIDAYTGEELWKLLDFNMGFSLADGYIVSCSEYSNDILCIGKGPSATSVTASPKVSMFGSSVLIEGKVTDISPGTEQLVQSKRFPSGVPAISDENQEAWMEYLYMQQARPADVTGVEVVLSVLDANNNYREIGTTTSDADGFFSFNWQPDIEGKFTVYASFDGSDSYYPSHAVAAFQVDSAPEATVAPTPAPSSLADQYLLPATGGIIAAIAVVGAAILLMLRRK